jgi:sialic acid synthase SpsE
MGDFKFSKMSSVFIVAEIGNNHEGNFDLAVEMIESAAKSGVDAVKFQSFIPDLYVSGVDIERLNRLKKFQLTYEQFRFLAKKASELNVVFFSTPFDIKTAEFLNEIQQIFKISSGDNNFYPLIETVAKFDKPTIISTGLADLDHIEKLVKFWTSKGGHLDNLALMHCVSSYPTPFDQANIAAVTTLRDKFFNITIGYSDHTLGCDAAVLSVGAGAKIIEKHFTLSNEQSDFRDHQLSLNPLEMFKLVKKIRQAESLMGSGEKIIQNCEVQQESQTRRSIAAAHDLYSGKVLEKDDLTWVRPGTGIPVGQENKVIGRKLNASIEMGQLIMEDFLV